MLQEESHLDGVIDPLGGSWYVETLTEELADKAWSLFQETEELGGLWGSLKAGWWQERIKVIQDQRRTALAQRQPVIVGVSDFTIGADEQTALADNIGPSTQGTSIKVGSSKGGDIPLLADFFDGEAFESLVRRAHEKKLQPIGLLNLGSLAEHNARTIFAQNFLAAGGISAENSESLSDISKLLEKAKVSQWRHVVLCSSDELYSEHLLSIAQELKMMDVHSFWVAGKAETAQQEEEWTRAGVTGFIHRGCDVPETLSILMDTLGGEV
jgi:methylmalonyl-CoA mutase